MSIELDPLDAAAALAEVLHWEAVGLEWHGEGMREKDRPQLTLMLCAYLEAVQNENAAAMAVANSVDDVSLTGTNPRGQVHEP